MRSVEYCNKMELFCDDLDIVGDLVNLKGHEMIVAWLLLLPLGICLCPLLMSCDSLMQNENESKVLN